MNDTTEAAPEASDTLHILRQIPASPSATADMERDPRAVILGLSIHEAVVMRAMCTSYIKACAQTGDEDETVRAAKAILAALTDMADAYRSDPLCAAVTTKAGYRRIRSSSDRDALNDLMATLSTVISNGRG